MLILKTTVNIFRLLRLLVHQTPSSSLLSLGKTFTRACGVQIVIGSDSVLKRIQEFSKQPNIELTFTSLRKVSFLTAKQNQSVWFDWPLCSLVVWGHSSYAALDPFQKYFIEFWWRAQVGARAFRFQPNSWEGNRSQKCFEVSLRSLILLAWKRMGSQGHQVGEHHQRFSRDVVSNWSWVSKF